MRPIRLKFVAGLNTACLSSEERPFIGLEHMESWTGRLAEGIELPFIQPGEDGTASVQPGDVLFGKLRPYLAKTWLADRPAYASTELLCLRPADGVNSRWLGYLFCSRPIVEWATATSDGTKMPRTSWDQLSEFRVHVPDASEQRATADYLDRETARIDALIASKQRMVELLDEHRRVFISQSVTYGLRDIQVLKQTGSPFAPEIPTTWSLNDLKHVVRRIVDTAHKTAPDVEGGSYLVVRTTNVRNGRLILEGGKYTDAAGFAEWTERGIPQPGDILLSREAPAGEACLVPGDIPLCIGQRMVWIQVDDARMLGEFGLYSLYAGTAQDYIKLLARSTTVAHLNMADIPNIPIALPPLDEQREIVAAIRSETERVDSTMTKLLHQVELLHELRQTIVSAAVTGHMEVPVVAA